MKGKWMIVACEIYNEKTCNRDDFPDLVDIDGRIYEFKVDDHDVHDGEYVAHEYTSFFGDLWHVRTRFSNVKPPAGNAKYSEAE